MVFVFCPKLRMEHNKKDSSSAVDLFKAVVFIPVNIAEITTHKKEGAGTPSNTNYY